MKVRLLFQQETPRSWARGIAITEILAQRDKDIVAQQQTTLAVSTSYHVTMLVDWIPTAEPLPPHQGALVWDVPEQVATHLHDPLYQPYFQQMPFICVPNDRVADQVRGLARGKVFVLPTLIPTPALNTARSRSERQVVVVLGPADREILPIISAVLAATQRVVVADIPLDLPIIVLPPDFPAYATALRSAQCVILPRPDLWQGDGFMVRDALYCGVPVLIPQHFNPEVQHPGIVRIRDWHALSCEHLPVSGGYEHRQQLVNAWGVHQHAQLWWNTFIELAKRTSRGVS